MSAPHPVADMVVFAIQNHLPVVIKQFDRT